MRDVPPSKAALIRARARDGRAGAGQGAMPRVHTAAPRERMSSSNQVIYLVPLHLAPEAREALFVVGEAKRFFKEPFGIGATRTFFKDCT